MPRVSTDVSDSLVDLQDRVCVTHIESPNFLTEVVHLIEPKVAISHLLRRGKG